jgi:hypothetical protein
MPPRASARQILLRYLGLTDPLMVPAGFGTLLCDLVPVGACPASAGNESDHGG